MPKLVPFLTSARGGQPGVDLKWAIVRSVLVVALACFLLAAAIALLQTDREAQQGNMVVGEAVGKHLDLQLLRIDSSLDLQQRFPDWDALIDRIMRPGQCVQFRPADDAAGQTSCAGSDASAGGAPGWFSWVYKRVLDPARSYERTVAHRGKTYGRIAVTSDAQAVVSRAWADIKRMLGLSALTIVALSTLVYFAIGNALRPTKHVLEGLNRLADGDLGARLPAFRLIELQRIADVFNGLAARLETTLRERSELAARLVDGQEQERRHLARELHDDLAQRISAIGALAASISATAAQACPSMLPDTQSLARMASGVMASLRETLVHLRPQEIDDLGLVACLKELIAGHNARACGRTTFTLAVTGDYSALPNVAAAHIYRIIQEGLTNAVKHSDARKAGVSLDWQLEPEARAGAKSRIVITVADDGQPIADPAARAPGFGLGLIGMRERVLALGGTMELRASPGGGTTLAVTVPAPVSAETSS